MRVTSLSRAKGGVAVLLGAALVAAPLASTPVFANEANTGVVISEAYLNGGSTGATWRNKFVELYNPTDVAISLAGKSLQYRAPANTTSAPAQVFPLSGSVPPNGYFLIQGASNASSGSLLPAADQVTTFGPGGAGGQIFLAAQSGALTLAQANAAVDPAIDDMLGYGTAAVFEGTAASVASTTTSLTRTDPEDDNNDNGVEFAAVTPTPTNSDGDTEPPVITPPDPPVARTIEQIQGAGATSPLAGVNVTTTGVITASYPTGGFNGYYIQTAGTGGSIDPATHTTSNAVFVYSPATAPNFPTIGSHVQVTGVVSEFEGTTEVTVTSTSDVVALSAEPTLPVPAAVAVPLTSVGRESFEGMLIAPQGAFTVTDNYDTNYYGSVLLNPGTTPLQTPTAVVEPGQPAIDLAAQNAEQVIFLDDGAGFSFNATANKNTPLPYLSNSAPVRIGAAVNFTKPVILEGRFGWAFQPTQQLTVANAASVQPATFANTRTPAPADLGGDITLASFNVLNYFTTTGDQLPACKYFTDKDGNPITVDKPITEGADCAARGAANLTSLERQQAKIVAAINALGADVITLEEIENSARFGKNRDDALSKLVAALNAAPGFAGTWAFVPSPATVPSGEDVIRTAFIYKKALVAPVGTSYISDDPSFATARRPLAQQFQLVAPGLTDSRFVAIVNHFKSKGSGDGANADTGDGQGASNLDRVNQAKALVAFSNAVQSVTGVSRVFLTGDFNAYLKEDPIDVLVAAGYKDLGSTTGKSTYAFDGAVGSLDHIFASASAVSSVNAVDVWNINSVESIALEYSRFNYNALNFYAPDAYRSSDHDPILVGIELASPVAPVIDSNLPKITGPAKVGATLKVKTGTWDPAPVTLTYRWLNNGKAIAGATKSTYKLKASDKGDRISVRVTGKKSGYPTAVRTSASVKIYKALIATPKPKILGTAKVGKVLTVKAGTWKPVRVTLKYQWFRSGVAIKGADSKKYTLKAADRGKKITIRVTGSKKGYLTETETRSIARIR